jgi:hypothetical protein
MAEKKQTHLQIYESLSKPPKTALRDITDGTLKGKTDINPQWRYKAMTETFGLVGLGWKYEILDLWHEPGAGNEVLCFAKVAVYIRDPETKEWSEPIIGVGGSKLINDFNRGPKSNDEGYKMAVTDAFSTSLKMIGVAADIYAGLWDGSKYKDIQEPKDEGEKEPAQQQPELAGGPDTKEEHDQINALLNTKYPNGEPMFNDVKPQILNWRKERTAAQVIESLKAAEQTRTEKYWEAAKKTHDEAVENREAMTKEVEEGAEQAFEIF